MRFSYANFYAKMMIYEWKPQWLMARVQYVLCSNRLCHNNSNPHIMVIIQFIDSYGILQGFLLEFLDYYNKYTK